MANTIQTNQSVTNIVDGVRATVSSNQITYLTSSNCVVGSQLVYSNAWTALSIGSATDVVLFTVLNDNSVYTASVIQVATASSAGGNTLAVLAPNTQLTSPWSGSLNSIYAKVVGGYPVGTATPLTGAVQWLVQQS